LGVEQLHAADDFARLAVDDAGRVDDGVDRVLEADGVDAALEVLVLELAVGVAELVRQVVDEAETSSLLPRMPTT
jgi:hypothetical protein